MRTPLAPYLPYPRNPRFRVVLRHNRQHPWNPARQNVTKRLAMLRRKSPKKFLFVLWIGVFSLQSSNAAKPDWCNKYLAYLSGDKSQRIEPQLESVDDMLWAFSNGLVPDPHSQTQLRAFEVYLKMRFGDSSKASSNTEAGALTSVIANIAKKLRDHPELEKVPMRSFVMASQGRSYPVTEELQSLTKELSDTGGSARGSLFQIDANLGYWKRILGWVDRDLPAELQVIEREWPKEEKDRVRKARQEWAAAEKARFSEFFESVIPASLRRELGDPTTAAVGRAKILFQILETQRAAMAQKNENTRALRLAMADLVHTIGLHDKEISAGLKSEDGMQRIAAIRRLLAERDMLAMILGHPEHFDGLLKKLELAGPSGVSSNKAFNDKLLQVEEEIASKAIYKTSERTLREIRQLSVMEAPFRSCIGGSDCSSRTYLTRALDPNYQYFTITDGDGYSNGHMTVVLGDVKGRKENGAAYSKEPHTKLAFIDKIMNVQNEDLPILVEAVRRSVLEKGYILVLPEDLGDTYTGISNDLATTTSLKRFVPVEGDPISGFKPHPHTYFFDSAHSRADNELAVRRVAELKLPEYVKLSPTELTHSWKSDKLDLKALVVGSRQLKTGDTDSKVRYIEAQRTIQSAGLELDPEFKQVIKKWLNDKQQPFRLRKRILLYQWLDQKADLLVLLRALEPSERVDLIQNILDTPRLRDLILKNQNQLPALIVEVRSNRKLRQYLAEAYSRNFAEAISKVLEAQDVSDSTALKIVRQIKKSFSTLEMGEATKILELARGTSVEGGLRDALITAYIGNLSNHTRLAREVEKNLLSGDEARQSFAEAILKSKSKGADGIPLIRAVWEIGNLASSRGVTRLQASEEWIANLGTDPNLKADYLRANLTSENFERLESKIPTEQREQVLHRIRESSMGLELRKLAKQKGVSMKEFSKFAPESFEIIRSVFPTQGKQFILGSPATQAGRSDDERQRVVTFKKPFVTGKTQVTQWLYALVMEENPSRFKDGPESVELTINGKKIQMRPNHPVERVTWAQAKEFCNRYTALMNNGIKYDLPLEARTELVSRAGTSTRFPFGDSEEELQQGAWYWANAEGSTKPVALLKPNSLGLYDTQGNVWEWQRDWYRQDTSGLPEIDPEGPSSGLYRVIRGGSWESDAQCLRSAYRGSSDPEALSGTVGFRLEGTSE